MGWRRTSELRRASSQLAAKLSGAGHCVRTCAAAARAPCTAFLGNAGDAVPVSPHRLLHPSVSELTSLRQSRRGLFDFAGLSSEVAKTFHERRLLGYSQEQLYEVVADVSHYSEFVPWCQHSVVVGNRDSQHLEVELEVGFKVFNERYTSMVTLTPTKRVTSAVSDSSLFHRLDNAWEFQPGPTPQSCWLSFSIDFAFKSPLYSKLASVFFSEVVERMMGAFEGRCKVLYGPSAFDKRRAARRGRAATA